jgi:hypothetical protein
MRRTQRDRVLLAKKASQKTASSSEIAPYVMLIMILAGRGLCIRQNEVCEHDARNGFENRCRLSWVHEIPFNFPELKLSGTGAFTSIRTSIRTYAAVMVTYCVYNCICKPMQCC